MEQRQAASVNPNGEMQLRLRASSAARSWSGLDAALYDTSGRLIEVPPRPRTNRLSARQRDAVIEYIEDHLKEDLSLAELAGVAGISASHFNSLFRQSVGLPAHRYVLRRRVDRAFELLAFGQVRLSDVARQSGFADQSHMARCMRKVLGTTPAEVVRSFH